MYPQPVLLCVCDEFSVAGQWYRLSPSHVPLVAGAEQVHQAARTLQQHIISGRGYWRHRHFFFVFVADMYLLKWRLSLYPVARLKVYIFFKIFVNSRLVPSLQIIHLVTGLQCQIDLCSKPSPCPDSSLASTYTCRRAVRKQGSVHTKPPMHGSTQSGKAVTTGALSRRVCCIPGAKLSWM